MTFKGLTWDHPRGRRALRCAVERRAPGLIEWDVQPLEGFESAPIADLCARYDLVVMDHPHLGEALAHGCIRPLEDVFAPGGLARMTEDAIGPSTRSYAMHGKSWALPLDAATQVMACRADLTGTPPSEWEEVVALAEHTGQVAMCIAGPHAFLSFLSLCAAIDPTLDLADSDRWPDDDTAARSYDMLARLYPLTPPATHGLNPIGMLDLMTSSDDVILCPHIYGYVNYAAPDLPRAVQFRDAPRIGGGRPGSIIGGTGIAISIRCTVTDDLRAHLQWLMSAKAQKGHIPDNDGQPSLSAAWEDEDVNAAWGGFYRNTRATIETATVRPRHDGYIAFQTAASATIRQALAEGAAAQDVVPHLKRSYLASGGKLKEPT